MLPNVSKKELGKMDKRMRVAANMPKDSLAEKQKAPATTTHAPIDEDTTLGLVFKRKTKVIVAPTEHSHSDGRAPPQNVVPSEGQTLPRDVIVIQEDEAESYKGKSL